MQMRKEEGRQGRSARGLPPSQFSHVCFACSKIRMACVDINSPTTRVFLVQSHFVRNWQRNVTQRATAKHFMESCPNDAISLLHQNFSHKWHNVPTLTGEICTINYVLHKRQIIRLHPCILGRSLISKSQNFASGQLASSWGTGTFPLAHGNLLGF